MNAGQAIHNLADAIATNARSTVSAPVQDSSLAIANIQLQIAQLNQEARREAELNRRQAAQEHASFMFMMMNMMNNNRQPSATFIPPPQEMPMPPPQNSQRTQDIFMAVTQSDTTPEDPNSLAHRFR